MYACQVIVSLMSDFVYTGHRSWWHPVDRALALTNAIMLIHTGVQTLQVLSMIFISCAAFIPYLTSVYYITQCSRQKYIIAHSIWHVASAACASFIIFHACNDHDHHNLICRGGGRLS